MKKSLFLMAAASALMLTACTSESDVLQSATKQEAPKAIGFDVFTQNATNVTRAGRAGVMNTGTLQMTGFGVFGYMKDGSATPPAVPTGYAATDVPDFMWNQQVSYNSTNAGWYYAPLKYWPNETNKDSQSSEAEMPDITTTAKNLDRLTFFAYAPWVKATAATGDTKPINEAIEAPDDAGITMITANDGKFNNSSTVEEPKVKYVVNKTDANKSVDLLWGVAPVGGLNYTAVNNTASGQKEGLPLLNLTKPAVNTNMKFLFQHALARLGFKVVLAADQVSAGGDFDYANTKVTIEEIDIEGKFGVEGVLNLNNTVENVANWNITTTGEKGEADNRLKITGTALAAHLRYDGTKNVDGETPVHTQQTVTGVTTDYSDVLQVSSVSDAQYNKYTTEVDAPAYSPSTPYFATATANATPTYAAYTTTPSETGYLYYYEIKMNTEKKAYKPITVDLTYPNATVWKNIVKIKTEHIKEVVSAEAEGKITLAAALAISKVEEMTYRKTSNNVYVPTGQKPELGDYVIQADENDFKAVPVPALATGTKKWLAVPNYFMVIPTNWDKGESPDTHQTDIKTIKVKIKYWVSTEDPNLKNGIVYTCNEVEKSIVLPHLRNGAAYNIKMILGMTSVKLEAEVADWTTTSAEINLPQNTAE